MSFYIDKDGELVHIKPPTKLMRGILHGWIIVGILALLIAAKAVVLRQWGDLIGELTALGLIGGVTAWCTWDEWRHDKETTS